MLYVLVGAGFQVLFHSPPGVLFTFPSQYYSLSVTGAVSYTHLDVYKRQDYILTRAADFDRAICTLAGGGCTIV